MADGQGADGWLFPDGAVGLGGIVFLGGLVVVAYVAEAAAERAGQADGADDLFAGSLALGALEAVGHDETPVPLQVGHLTQRRFLNFWPLPVSHQPPLPSQPGHGFFFLSSSSAIIVLLAKRHAQRTRADARHPAVPSPAWDVRGQAGDQDVLMSYIRAARARAARTLEVSRGAR